ncbi:ChbG/HpnK family deacetylase [bacterium]|nr:MAG: ChbG/HpnK family deacetylase [bacterium]
MTELLVRCDDAGASAGTNRAIRACVAKGSARNVSIMAVAPAFEDLTAGGPIPACCGVHATINSEWDAPRWGPLTAARSLIEGDGSFRRFPNEHQETGFDLEEIKSEIAAQIAKVRAAGFEPQYLDEHMGFSWLPGVRDVLSELAQREGLVYAPSPSIELKVFHPSEDDADSRRWIHKGLAPGSIAQERAAETAYLLSESWPERKLIAYAELTP